MRPEASKYPAPPPGSNGAVQQLWNNMNEGLHQLFWSAHIAGYGTDAPKGSPYPSSYNRNAYGWQDQCQQSDPHTDEEGDADADSEETDSCPHQYQARSDIVINGTCTINWT